MLQVLQNKSLDLLETLVTTLEQYESVQKRPHVFADKCVHNGEVHHKSKKKHGKGHHVVEDHDAYDHMSPN